MHRVDLDHPDQPAVDLTPLPPGSRVFAVDPETTVPGTVIVCMNPRPLSSTSSASTWPPAVTTPLVERTDPAETFLLDRAGRPTWYVSQDAEGTHEIAAVDPDTGERRILHRVGGPEHPMGIFLLPTPDGRGALLGDYQDSDDLRLTRIDRDTGEQTVVAAVDGPQPGHPELGRRTPCRRACSSAARTGEVIAARFTGDRPRVVPIDPHFAEVQAALEKLSDGVLDTVSSDLDEQRWIATFVHDRRADGTTWFYDHATGERRLLSGGDQHPTRPSSHR